MKDYQDIHRFKMQPERKARPNAPAKIFYGILKPTTGRYAQKLKFPKPGSNLGYGPQNGVRIGLFTLKLDLWRAFGYTGFWVHGLFGKGAFWYRGFSVYGLFGSHPI
jgi:hypothetical protein